MAFIFGAFDSRDVEGLTATLRAWPSPSFRLDTVDAVDGVFFARSALGTIEFTFDVRLEGTTPAEVLGKRDLLLAGCAPTLGLQALTPEVGDGWVWYATASKMADLVRAVWTPGALCQLRGDLTFYCSDGVGWAAPDETITGATSVTIVRALGNLPSHPTIEVTGECAGVRLTIGGVQLDVAAVPLAAGQRLVLDFQRMDFAVWAGAVKVAHAAGGLSSFNRVALPLGSTVVTAAPLGGGTVTGLTVKANSRRA